MKALVIVEHDNQKILPATLAAIRAACQLSNDVDLLIAGYNCTAAAEQASKIGGIKQVFVSDAVCYQYGLAESLGLLTAEMGKNYEYILAPADTFGKNFMPRAAALLDVAQISDVIKIIDKQTFIRPIYAGNALATVKSNDNIKVITVRTTAFDPAVIGDTQVKIEKFDKAITSEHSKYIKLTASKSERPELTSAKIIISGGRGLQSGENFHLLEKIADKLGAAIGASRAAVDAGFIPNDFQVGQTGKIVAPDLYIAVGISGAIQHLAGMKDSKIIVAINKDEDAPIFEIADYGLVADLFEVLPELEKAL